MWLKRRRWLFLKILTKWLVQWTLLTNRFSRQSRGEIKDLTRALFAQCGRSPLTQKWSSRQKQHGVDVYGSTTGNTSINLQVCNAKEERRLWGQVTIVEFDTELIKAENFKPQLGHWTFATTAPMMRDSRTCPTSVRTTREGRKISRSCYWMGHDSSAAIHSSGSD